MRNGRDGGNCLAAGGDAIVVLRQRSRFGIRSFITFRPGGPGRVAATAVGGPRADSREEKRGDQQEEKDTFDAMQAKNHCPAIMADPLGVWQAERQQNDIYTSSSPSSLPPFSSARRSAPWACQQGALPDMQCGSEGEAPLPLQPLHACFPNKKQKESDAQRCDDQRRGGQVVFEG